MFYLQRSFYQLLFLVVWAFDSYYSFFQNIYVVSHSSKYYYFGLDGISLLFVLITTIFLHLCIVNALHIPESSSVFVFLLFTVYLLLICVFYTIDLFCFYILFEAILLPFFLIIGLRGSTVRKLHASYLLLFYTLFGSIFLLFVILVLVSMHGTTDMFVYTVLTISTDLEIFLWFCIVLSFSIKIPIFPFYLWLTEAHVEAPTEASVILASILLKLGVYGYIRILYPLFDTIQVYYSEILQVLSLLSVLYTSIVTVRQTDVKRVVAYSSIGHMNICILGIVSPDSQALLGSYLLMFGHSFVSGGLFFLVGILYNKSKTKVIFYYSGISEILPLFTIFFFLFLIANTAFPGTCNFYGEFLILDWVARSNHFIGVLVISISIFFCSVYCIWLFNRTSFGKLTLYFQTIRDISFVEFFYLVYIALFIFICGLVPRVLLEFLFFNAFSIW